MSGGQHRVVGLEIRGERDLVAGRPCWGEDDPATPADGTERRPSAGDSTSIRRCAFVNSERELAGGGLLAGLVADGEAVVGLGEGASRPTEVDAEAARLGDGQVLDGGPPAAAVYFGSQPSA